MAATAFIAGGGHQQQPHERHRRDVPCRASTEEEGGGGRPSCKEPLDRGRSRAAPLAICRRRLREAASIMAARSMGSFGVSGSSARLAGRRFAESGERGQRGHQPRTNPAGPLCPSELLFSRRQRGRRARRRTGPNRFFSDTPNSQSENREIRGSDSSRFFFRGWMSARQWGVPEFLEQGFSTAWVLTPSVDRSTKQRHGWVRGRRAE